MSQSKPFALSRQAVWRAYKKVKANKGSAGIDGQSIEEFEKNLAGNLYKLWNRMASGSYMPPAVRRVEIPKATGGTRPLGIPTVADRIAQMVVKDMLEPILEPQFHVDSYGYRPHKSAHDALRVARQRCWRTDWVLDVDIKGFFDNIDHELLMRAVRRHTDCRWVLLYIERWLGELAQQLREDTYTPKPVRRVHIPKPNGKTRPLGIACLRDRVCQMAAMLVLEPIFEADLPPEQHAYRRNRNAQSAVQEVHGLLTRGYNDVVDADLSGYFDTIPHPELMKSVARRIVDGKVLRLIKQWLTAPVEEKMRDGKVQRTTANRDNQCGIPQGSPISPLLSNLYMRRFIMGWKRLGIEQRLSARIVNYADDLVICCKGRNASQAMTAMRGLMAKLKLTVNEEKTRLCRLPEGEFDFLGYTYKRLYSARTRKPYIGTRPSKKSIKRMIESIRLQTSRSLEWMDAGEMVMRLNQKLGGWTNYFRLGPVTQSYRFIDRYTTTRLRRWLCKKHKQRSRGLKRYPDEYFYNQLGLIQLPKLPQRLPWAKA